MKHVYLMATIFVCLALTGCGAAAAVPTVPPPTEAPTSIPQPTVAPTATIAPTSVPTPTSAPGEISRADQLGLGAGFVAVPEKDLGAKMPPDKMPPEMLIAAGLADLAPNSNYYSTTMMWHEFPLKADFAFVNADNTQFVYGYTVTLAESKDQSRFDKVFVDSFYAKERLWVLRYTQDSAKIKDVAVGDKSSGVTSKPVVKGFAWRLNALMFRVGSTGAYVFTLYPADAEPPIDIVKLAQFYADSIKQ